MDIMVYGVYDSDMDGFGNNLITRLITEKHKIINVTHPEKVYEALLSFKDELKESSATNDVYLFINDLALGSNVKVFDILDDLNNVKIVINDHHEPNDNLIEYFKKKFPNKIKNDLVTNYKDTLCSIEHVIEKGVNFNIRKGKPKLTSATEIFYKLVTDNNILRIFDTSVKDKLEDIVKLIMLFDTFRFTTEDYISPYFKTDPLTFNKISDIINKELWINKLYKFITTKTITNDTDIDMSLVDVAIEALNIDKADYRKCAESIVNIKFSGYNVALVFYNKRAGLLGEFIRNKLTEDNVTDIDFIMVANYPNMGIYSFKDSINLSEVARSNGGGGHPKAAGFPTKSYDDFIDIISSKK